jgi:hypothetical protein
VRPASASRGGGGGGRAAREHARGARCWPRLAAAADATQGGEGHGSMGTTAHPIGTNATTQAECPTDLHEAGSSVQGRLGP